MTLSLQVCTRCGAVQYPSRAVCRSCLADSLAVQDVGGAGRLVAVATVHHSLEPDVTVPLPTRIGTVLLDGGARMICLVNDGLVAGHAVQVTETPGRNGSVLYRAGPRG